MDHILENYNQLLHIFAEITVHTLEIIGISVVIVGSIKVLIQLFKRFLHKSAEGQNPVIALGRSLGLALEFKMGAEIVKTVIVRDLKELLILGIIIILRAILAILIHWEITTEEKEEKAHSIAREAARQREEEEKKREEKEGKND
jgi:uncharacterized membrane protein